jgi:hypothetical protein
MLEPRRIRRILLLILLAGAALFAVFFTSFSFKPESAVTVKAENPDRKLATEIAKGIITACPIASPNDKNARELCGEKLIKFALLGDSMSESFVWGLETKAGDYELASNHTTTHFNDFVWRRIYLSLFMFPGKYKVEQVGDRTILRLPYQFRNQLDMGDYPYPYWHSKKKWDAFQLSPELLFIFEKGKIAASLRSVERDKSRPYVAHEWNGKWTWTDEKGQQQPTVTLYKAILSSTNPHVSDLDVAYRAFESESRKFNCAVCHNPGNPSKMYPLSILNYPNQALSGRHKIVSVIENDTMPPASVDAKKVGHPAGIENEAEKEKLLKLAKAFAKAGDLAIAFEKSKAVTQASSYEGKSKT